MKISMQITLEGLLRALRWRAHNAAEDFSAARSTARRAARGTPLRGQERSMRNRSDDRARR